MNSKNKFPMQCLSHKNLLKITVSEQKISQGGFFIFVCRKEDKKEIKFNEMIFIIYKQLTDL